MIPRHEHLALLAAATGKPKEFWIAHPDSVLSPGEHALLDRWRQARLKGMPLAYLIGQREFYGRSFWVSPDTLIPRADTELLIDTTKKLVKGVEFNAPARLADLGTGSGCIAVSLALEIPKSTIIASDLSPKALRLARNNAAWLGASARISFLQGSWWGAFAGVKDKFHGIVSNPPYIAGGDPHLAQGDLPYEPPYALTPLPEQNCSGLEAIMEITSHALERLLPGGFLLIEHGFDQQNQVIGIFKSSGLSKVESLRDLAGNPRAVVGFQAQAPNPL